VEGLFESSRRGVHEGTGHGPADVVDHQVEATELIPGVVDQGGHGLEVAEVGGDDHGPAAGILDQSGHCGQLVSAARRDQHIGAGLGQAHRGGRTDAASGAGDDGHLVGHPETVENHGRSPLGRRQC
jgi:hypothetical protein